MVVCVKWYELKLRPKLLLSLSRSQNCFLYTGTRKSSQNGSDAKYSNTVSLPKTEFPLRLDYKKRIERDRYIYKVCGFQKLYNWQRENVQGPEFILHDGPPYANGKPHMGHAINKILKDTINRYKLLQGHRIHYVPGWDCHGLPIEHKVLGGKAINLPPIEVRKNARAFAEEAIKEQKEAFKEWGILADWGTGCYFTFDKAYVKNQLQLFLKLYEKGLIYRDYKPVFWSPSSRTALAEAELEYNTEHVSTSVVIKLRLAEVPEAIRAKLSPDSEVYALVWTTTPWTLPMNAAICYNPDISYSLVSSSADEKFVMATDLVPSLQNTLGKTLEILHTFPGCTLDSAAYIHPCLPERKQPFLSADHVTTNKGTGLVHTAPAHGPEDFLVALRHSLPLESCVDESGCYTHQVNCPSLVGLPVLDKGSDAVLAMLETNIVHLEQLKHSYPYDWRTKKPVILRASHQWFIDTKSVKQKAIDVLKHVKMHPEHDARSVKGFVTQLEARPYWCISRQRVWGVPIPVLYHQASGKPVISRCIVDRLSNLIDERGTDVWWSAPLEEIVTTDILKQTDITSVDELQKGQDIMDIWLDSGTSWAAVLGEDKVADLYLEGVDQFTGWFQSSLMTSVALRGIAPFKSILAHGFAVDGQGRKMSKSLGNVVDPQEIVGGGNGKPGFGVDTLRWWVACHATQHISTPVSDQLLQASAEAVHKIRIVLRFLLGTLHDFPGLTSVPWRPYTLDLYMLHLLQEFHQQVCQLYEKYQLNKVCMLLTNFVTNEVSALYCHLTKDRLYCDHVDSLQRRACQTVMYYTLETLIRAIAPVLPHLAEEVYLYHPCRATDADSVFKSQITTPVSSWQQMEVVQVMELALEVRRMLLKMSPGTNTFSLDVTVFTSGTTLDTLKVLQKPAITAARKQPYTAIPVALFAFMHTTKAASSKEEKKKKLESIIAEADDLYSEDKLRDVYNLLYPLKETEDVEILWRLARVMYNLTQQTCPELEKKSLTYEAYNIMEKALKLGDDNFAVHKWYSVLLDAKASYDGTRERVTQLLNVKKHMLRAVELNPKDATTFYMLGFWCYNIASMPWYQRKIASAIFATPPTSTYEEALHFFKKAEEVNPNFYSQNLLMLGKTLLQLGKQEQALYYLNLAATYPMRTEEDLQVNKEAKQLLNSLKRK